jgi:fatty-acyl-CoA synthase
MEVRVVDRQTRRPLPPGEVGEILVRGRLTPGYYRDPERNAASFDAEGFLLSGDLGLIGDDGRLRFRGRLKEMVKTGGINVAPLEVEEVLMGHPAVEQAYVVGLPDPRREEILVAVVVLRADQEAEPDALRALCQDALAAYKVPQEIHLMKREELPLTGTGKVQKFRLAERLASARGLGSLRPGIFSGIFFPSPGPVGARAPTEAPRSPRGCCRPRPPPSGHEPCHHPRPWTAAS